MLYFPKTEGPNLSASFIDSYTNTHKNTYIYASKANAINNRPSETHSKLVEIRKIPKCKNLRFCLGSDITLLPPSLSPSSTTHKLILERIYTYTCARIPCHYIYFDALSVNVTVYLKLHAHICMSVCDRGMAKSKGNTLCECRIYNVCVGG